MATRSALPFARMKFHRCSVFHLPCIENRSHTLDQPCLPWPSVFKLVALCISCFLTIRLPSLPGVLSHPCLRHGCVRHILSPRGGETRCLNSSENFEILKFESSSTDELVAAKLKKTQTHVRTSDWKASIGRARSDGRWNASEHARSWRTKNPPESVGGGVVPSKQTDVLRRKPLDARC